MPGITALGLLILIAAWAIVTGIMELVAAVRLRKIIDNEWLLVLAGIASVMLGILLLFQPAAGALVLLWWIGAWALLFGILLMILAFRVRNWKVLSRSKRPAFRQSDSPHKPGSCREREDSVISVSAGFRHMSSSGLPFVSRTSFITNTIETAAKTV